MGSVNNEVSEQWKNYTYPYYLNLDVFPFFNFVLRQDLWEVLFVRRLWQVRLTLFIAYNKNLKGYFLKYFCYYAKIYWWR